MSFDNPEKGVESLAMSVIYDADNSWRPFCPCCKDNHRLLWKILTEYEPQSDALSSLCSGFYDGHCECCSKFKFAVDRAHQYANATGLDWREILATWEKHRNYWHMNYYQPANQPPLDGNNVFVFDDLDAFRDAVGDEGFICPSCGHISNNPYECDDDECDWKSYGLFGCLGKGAHIFVKSEMRGETIFMPVAFGMEEKNLEKGH